MSYVGLNIQPSLKSQDPEQPWTSVLNTIHCRGKLNLYIYPSTKINSKWMEDLNIKPQILKLLEEKEGNVL